MLDPPVLARGSFRPRPSVITKGWRIIDIGATAYIRSGYDVIIRCYNSRGTRPLHWLWFRNGSLHPTRKDVTSIRITNARDGDVFKCRMWNHVAYDTESSTIYVEYGKCVRMYK